MKTKTLLLTAMATFGMTIATMAQNVPNYIPTNGLVGWWPFNGNANDESGNGNNGTVNGATLTTDRFGNATKAYSFDGVSNHIRVSDNNSSSLDLVQDYTMSAWVNLIAHAYSPCVITKHLGNIDNLGTYTYLLSSQTANFPYYILQQATPHFDNLTATTEPSSYQLNQWYYLSCTYNKSQQRLIHYINGVAVDSINVLYDIQNTSIDLLFGACFVWDMNSLDYFWNGKLDDIGIWNRALTQQEITTLYNAVNCANNTTITPQTNSLATGSTATFIASTTDPNPSYVWQSDFGQGFQTLNNFGNYSGANTAALNIANVQLSEHNQPIRVITTSGNCIDTSNIAIINIADTCIATITDTTFITVTDTLIINATITALNPPSNSNTIKVFPNPTNDHITIDYGNFSLMNGYQLKIENSLGQQVFQTNITQQSDYLNLTTWGGNGLYFVHIIDPQGNTIDIRKIVLQ
jgi:hypothetical protein